MPPRMARLRFHPLDYASATAFLAYSASAVVTPICLVLLAQEIGFGLAGAGRLELTRGGLVLVVLVASAFAAGLWGKAGSIAGGMFLLAAGLFVYAAAPSYAAVLLAMALMGLGGGIVEALLNPLIHDCHPRDSGRYLNLLNAFWSVGVFATVLLAGDLLTRGVSWRAVMIAIGGVSLLAGILFLVMLGRAPRVPRVPVREVAGRLYGCVTAGRFWVFFLAMILAGAAEGGFTFWAATFIQLRHGGDPRAGGVGTACFAGGMLAMRLAAGWLVPQSRLWVLILASAVAGAGVSLVVPAVTGLHAAYLVLFFAGLTVACFWPTIQSYAASRLGRDETSVFVLLSVAGIPGFAGGSWIMGEVGEVFGLDASFRLLPGLFLLLAAVTAMERLVRPRAER